MRGYLQGQQCSPLWLHTPVSNLVIQCKFPFLKIGIISENVYPFQQLLKMSLWTRNALTVYISTKNLSVLLIAHLESQSSKKKMRDYIFNEKKEIFDFLYNAASEQAYFFPLGLFEWAAVVPVEHSLVNKEKTGRLEPAPKTKPCPSQCSAVHNRAADAVVKWFSHTQPDWRNHFYWQCLSKLLLFSGEAQICTVCLILWFDDEVRISSASMRSLKNGGERKKMAPSDSSSDLEPKCHRQTHKCCMMIINTPIRHLLCFQACLDCNGFTN